MGLFTPEFDGQLTLERLPDDFAARIQRRVEDGLLVRGRRDRADYRITSVDQNTVTFVAEGLLTTYNIGLNQVTIRRGGRNQLQYHVSYRGWTKIAVVHGALLGIVWVIGYALIPGARADIAASPHGPALAAGIAGFFCLAWPWILTILHRGPAERALQRILEETLGGSKAPGRERVTAEARRAS